MNRAKKKINLFKYLNYREFLKDWFEVAKNLKPAMSYRLFSKRAELKSTNFLMLVIQGKRNLGPVTIKKFIKALKLIDEEQNYFENLVAYNQASGHHKKLKYYHALVASKKYQKLGPLGNSQSEYCSRWYYPVIRELVSHPEFQGNLEWIVRRLENRVTSEEVLESLQLLEKLKLIKKSRKGTWEQCHTIISTGPEVTELDLFTYYEETLKLSQRMLHDVPAHRRDISSLILSIPKSQLASLKTRIQEFRKQILKEFSQDLPPEEVVQINLWMYPVTSELENINEDLV